MHRSAEDAGVRLMPVIKSVVGPWRSALSARRSSRRGGAARASCTICIVTSLHDVRMLPAVLNQVLELVVLLNDDMTRGLAGYGLTPARARLVWVLHHEGALTQRALADALKVSPRNITGLVDGLVTTGYVTREPHPTDRRAILVSLTENGASTLAQMDQSHQELAQLLFGDMSARQLGAFVNGLGHVLSRLREGLKAEGGTAR